MSEKAIRGISFPFRIGGRGGVVMSGKAGDYVHIKEGLKQLLGTYLGERVMRRNYGIPHSLSVLFNELNETTKNMAIFQIEEVIREWEPRIEIVHLDITEQQVDNGIGYFVDLTYSIVDSDIQDNVIIQVQ